MSNLNHAAKRLSNVGPSLAASARRVWEALDLLSQAERDFAAAVRSREPMDDETFYTTYYAKWGIPQTVPATVRRIYGEQLGHDPRRLRPEDFDPKLWDIDSVELVMEVEEVFGVSVSDDEATRTSGSVDSIVRLIAGKLAPEKPSASTAVVGHPPPAPAKRTASSAESAATSS